MKKPVTYTVSYNQNNSPPKKTVGSPKKYVEKPSIYSVDNLDGHTFEFFCADMLKKLGYADVRVTQASGDNGVDILASYNGVPYAIQCKRYAKKVGNKAVQEVFSGANYYKCQKAIVITNNYFTDQAIDAAKKLGVTLWDRDFLNKMMRVSYSDSASAKKAIANSNYQAKSRKTKNDNAGCGIGAMIVVFLLIIFLIFYFL